MTKYKLSAVEEYDKKNRSETIVGTLEEIKEKLVLSAEENNYDLGCTFSLWKNADTENMYPRVNEYNVLTCASLCWEMHPKYVFLREVNE